jgi:hypothetical protein
LTFTIDSYRAKRKNWNDGDSGLFEKHISEIIIAMMDTIDAERVFREEREAEEKRRIREERKRAILEEKREQENANVELLVKDANDYDQALKIYEYIAVLEQGLINRTDKSELNKARDFIAWARKKADWLNPLIGRNDELLGKRHKKMVPVIMDDVKEE